MSVSPSLSLSSFLFTLQAVSRTKCLKSLLLSLSQILGISKEPGGVFVELHEVHHQFTLPPFPLHRGFCIAGHAAVWRTVSITLK